VLSNLTIVVGVPGLAQILDVVAHRMAGATAPPRATLAVCAFALVSASFHLYVMRRGVFLTGHRGRSLFEDIRRMPGLVTDFAFHPLNLLSNMAGRVTRAAESETAL
jgi:hypothetical protein